MNLVNEGSFMIGLEIGKADVAEQFFQLIEIILKPAAPVNLGLTLTQQIEVRTVYDQYILLGHGEYFLQIENAFFCQRNFGKSGHISPNPPKITDLSAQFHLSLPKSPSVSREIIPSFFDEDEIIYGHLCVSLPCLSEQI